MRRKHSHSYGLGRIFKRGTIWWVSLYVNGKEHRESSKSSIREDAEVLLGELLKKRSLGLIDALPDQPHSVASLLDDYLRRRKLAPGTLATYKSQAETHLKPFFSGQSVATITSELLSRYRSARERQESAQGNNRKGEKGTPGKRVAGTSINRELALLRAALRDYERRSSTPFKVPHFPMEREDNTRHGFLTDTQFEQKLYPHLPRHLRALTACAFYAGGRKSEWLRLNWDWVDFGRLSIYFPKTKNKRPREVPITPGYMLESLIEARNIHELLWREESAVFCYDGRRLTTFRRSWSKAVAAAGFPELKFHDLRRSANKYMRDKGVPQPVRMAVMGHKTTAMDIRYGVVDETDLNLVREKLASNRKPPALKRVK